MKEIVMKIMVIGSTQYLEKIKEYAEDLKKRGFEVLIPAFDNEVSLNELQLCEYNRSLMEQADEVHIIWNQRSMGTIFDFGMAFAMRKPIKVAYLENKTFAGIMHKYESQSKVGNFFA